MEELDLGHGAQAAGGLTFSFTNWALGFVATKLAEGAMAGVGYMVANGVPPDYSRTTAMGDMY